MNGVQVPLEKVVGKLQEQIARLTFELAMTQVALEEALEKNAGQDNGSGPVESSILDERTVGPEG